MENYISRLSRFWVVSGKVMTVVSLILIPLMVILTHYYIYQQASSVGHYNYDPKTGKYTIKYPQDFDVVLKIVFYVQIIVFIFILIVYPPYPAPASIEHYFKERGYRKAVDEYEFIKKVLYVIVPLVLFFGLWSTEWIAKPLVQMMPSEILQEVGVDQRNISDSLDNDDLYVDSPTLWLILIFIAAILKMIFIRMRKDFRLYYARGCFVICQREGNEVKRMSYFIRGLNSYNHYLRRLISLEISDLKTKVYSKIGSSPLEKKTEIMNSIISSFSPDKDMQANALQPVRLLAEFTQISVTDFLTKQPLLNKLKEWTAIASVIVTMVVAVVPALLKF